MQWPPVTSDHAALSCKTCPKTRGPIQLQPLSGDIPGRGTLLAFGFSPRAATATEASNKEQADTATGHYTRGAPLAVKGERGFDTAHERSSLSWRAEAVVRVNDRLQTTAPDMSATGECAGSPQFTQLGEDDSNVVLDNLAGGRRTTRGRLFSYCLFTDPELAHVGMNEAEANAKGVPYCVAWLPMSLSLRTRTLSQTRRFLRCRRRAGS
jgi:Pyridine nucleotide-disulphide oxidoreductase, dimerisation domain